MSKKKLSRLDHIRNNRIEKVKALKKLHINPYPSISHRSHTIVKARKSLQKKVQITGRIVSKREHGKIIFADIQDETGKVQVLFRKQTLQELFSNIVELLDTGDFIEVKGTVMKTKSGEVTVDAEQVRLISKSIRPLPDQWHGFKDKEERFRMRYVDLLMNPQVKKIFLIRAKIVRFLRNYLEKKGFVEVSTPVLQPIYGGTTARPFITHHNALDTDLYLRIADELYLKRLIVGGFEKVYEIGVDFRNEGIDRWHNPEFTQLEFYQAYADYTDLMNMTEDMLGTLVKEIKKTYKIPYGNNFIDFSTPWKRVSYRELIKKYTDIDIANTDEKKIRSHIKEKKLDVALPPASDIPELLDIIFKHAVRPTIINPTFVVDYPSYMRPLAKKKESDPSQVEAFQLIVAGTELINAYSELNDPFDQRKRWEKEESRGKKGIEEHQVIDKDYIRALEYGMPPTAGWGMGIERLTAILTNSHSIKEVILFPTLKPERDI